MSSQFHPYLESVRAATLKRQEFYVSTDAKEKPPLDLMVKRVAEKKRQGQQEEEFAPVQVLEGIRTLYLEHKHVLLVGRPGSGKSTALDQLLIEEVTRSLKDPTLPIPVLVQLKYDRPILKSIYKTLRGHRLRLSETELDDLLFDGKLLLLLDGVNEIPRHDLQQELQQFREDNLNVPMVFTTRDLVIGGALGIEKQLEMQPLTEAQMQAFIREFDPEQAEQMLRQLKDRLRELGQTPLLLWMLCDVFQRKGTIPENLGLVFREFTQHYERNLKEGMRIESDRDWWQPVLQQLAWVMMQGEKPTEFRVAIRREEAVRAIGQFLDQKVPYAENFARKCLLDLQKHHLIQTGTNSEELEFRHQLIQEYYAAEALLSQLDRLEAEQLKQEFLNFLKWTEPITLILALISEDQAVHVVKLAFQCDLKLGAKLAGAVKPEAQKQTVGFLEVLELPDEFKIQLLQETKSISATPALLKFVQHPELKIVRYSVYVLGEIRSEAAIPDLLTLLEHSDFNVSWFAAWALGEIRAEAAIPDLLALLEHSDHDIALKAQAALQAICSEIAIPSLFKLMEHRDSDVSWRAATLLGRTGSETIIPNLLKLVDNINPDLRERAAWALGELGSETAISSLVKLVEDPIPVVRETVAEALGQVSSLAAVSALERLTKDEDSYVRERAERSLRQVNYVVPQFDLDAFKQKAEVEKQKATEIRQDLKPTLSSLLKLLQFSKSADMSAQVALGEFIKQYAGTLIQYIPHLLSLIPTYSSEKINRIILNIQENCKYYNYEIYQAYLEAQKADRQTPQNNDRSPITNNYYIDWVGNLNARDTIVHGNQIGEQHNHPEPDSNLSS